MSDINIKKQHSTQALNDDSLDTLPVDSSWFMHPQNRIKILQLMNYFRPTKFVVKPSTY